MFSCFFEKKKFGLTLNKKKQSLFSPGQVAGPIPPLIRQTWEARG